MFTLLRILTALNVNIPVVISKEIFSRQRRWFVVYAQHWPEIVQVRIDTKPLPFFVNQPNLDRIIYKCLKFKSLLSFQKDSAFWDVDDLLFENIHCAA